jgi:hypothetical protein
MNWTPVQHGVIAVVMQLILLAVFSVFGNADAFAITLAALLPPVFFFAGREHAQQQRWLEKNKGLEDWGAVAGALAFWTWDKDSKLDMLFPLVGALVVAIVYIVARHLLP